MTPMRALLALCLLVALSSCSEEPITRYDIRSVVKESLAPLQSELASMRDTLRDCKLAIDLLTAQVTGLDRKLSGIEYALSKAMRESEWQRLMGTPR